MIMRVTAFLAALMLAGAAAAQKAEVFSDGGAAIRGYDRSRTSPRAGR
jgi:hypothetical protein